jgi:ferredoxin
MLLTDSVQIKPNAMEHTGGLNGEFQVAFADISKVSTSDDPTSLVRGVKVGVGLPKTKIGTWHHDGVEDYFCVHHDGPAVVLELSPGHTYAKVVVTVENPDDLVAQIQAAMSAGPDAAG